MIGLEGSRATLRGNSDRSVVAEFADAARSTAESLLHQQKQQIANRVSGIATALEDAVLSLDSSQNSVIARYVERAGDQVRSLSHRLHGRHWSELVADTEDFARRQPTVFVLSAVAIGFLAGRFLWTAISAENRDTDAVRDASRREAAREVTAAVASAPGVGGGTGDLAGHTVGSSATLDRL
jgi:hypothetical protein